MGAQRHRPSFRPAGVSRPSGRNSQRSARLRSRHGSPNSVFGMNTVSSSTTPRLTAQTSMPGSCSWGLRRAPTRCGVRSRWPPSMPRATSQTPRYWLRARQAPASAVPCATSSSPCWTRSAWPRASASFPPPHCGQPISPGLVHIDDLLPGVRRRAQLQRRVATHRPSATVARVRRAYPRRRPVAHSRRADCPAGQATDGMGRASRRTGPGRIRAVPARSAPSLAGKRASNSAVC